MFFTDLYWFIFFGCTKVILMPQNNCEKLTNTGYVPPSADTSCAVVTLYNSVHKGFIKLGSDLVVFLSNSRAEGALSSVAVRSGARVFFKCNPSIHICYAAWENGWDCCTHSDGPGLKPWQLLRGALIRDSMVVHNYEGILSCDVMILIEDGCRIQWQ